MSDLCELLDLIERHGLATLPNGSKDRIAVQSLNFSRNFGDYLAASREAMKDALASGGSIDINAYAEPLDRYELASTLYAPGLIGALARALIAEHARVGKLRAHVSEQVTHVRTRIGDGDKMGASVWRIALEDVARENTALLTEIDA